MVLTFRPFGAKRSITNSLLCMTAITASKRRRSVSETRVAARQWISILCLCLESYFLLLLAFQGWQGLLGWKARLGFGSYQKTNRILWNFASFSRCCFSYYSGKSMAQLQTLFQEEDQQERSQEMVPLRKNSTSADWQDLPSWSRSHIHGRPPKRGKNYDAVGRKTCPWWWWCESPTRTTSTANFERVLLSNHIYHMSKVVIMQCVKCTIYQLPIQRKYECKSGF